MSFYLDASVMVAMVVRENTSAAVTSFLSAASEELLVSEYAAAEVSSALSRLVRTGALKFDMASAGLSDFDAWRRAEASAIQIEDFDVQRAHLLVRRFDLKLRTPDAMHLAITLRVGAELVTYDRTLSDAASACGVATVRP